MRRVSPNSHQGVSLLGSRGEVDGRGSGGLLSCEAGDWAWGSGGAGKVAPIGLSGAEGEGGVALGGEAGAGVSEGAVCGDWGSGEW
jgi:hypothetical protein